MRKSLAIFGGSLFQDIQYKDQRAVPTKKKIALELSKYYKIDNYSMDKMSITRANHLIQALPMNALYSDCILALGEADLDQPEVFKANLAAIIASLKMRQVRPLLVSLPKELTSDPRANLIQDIIDEIAVSENVDYIYEGSTTKLVSYTVLEEQDYIQAILTLC